MKRSRSEEDDGPHELWAGVPADILGAVLRLLPCFADRSASRSVCRHWRASAASLPPPLPLLAALHPKSRTFSCLSPGGTLLAARHAPATPAGGPPAGDVSYVGASGAWLAGVAPAKDSRGAANADGECFLVNALSHEVVRLPDLRTPEFHDGSHSSSSTTGRKRNHAAQRLLSVCNVVLSAPPDSGSNYIVAACSNRMALQSLALWQPGMARWRVCATFWCGYEATNLAFCRGKLYFLRRFEPRLYALQLEEDDRGGVSTSRIEQCVTEPLPPHPVNQDDPWGCNLAVWRDKLLLIIRYYGSVLRPTRTVCGVRMLALDLCANPCGLTEIRSLDGDCIFVDSYGCHSFPAGLHHGAVEGDLIYFVNRYDKYSYGYFFPPYDAFVYNVRNGAMRPFAAELPPVPFAAPQDRFDLPLWLLPSE